MEYEVLFFSCGRKSDHFAVKELGLDVSPLWSGERALS